MTKSLIAKFIKSVIPAALAVVLAIGASIWMWRTLAPHAPRTVTYSELVAAVEANRISEAEIRGDAIAARLRDGEGNPAGSDIIVADRLPNTDETALVKDMQTRGITVRGKPDHGFFLSPAFWVLVPFVIVPLMLLSLQRWTQKGGGQASAKPMSFGKSKAKLYDKSKDQPVTFGDVAGVEESKGELEEIVRYLKEPDKFRAIGARVPKGVLLVGPPGTGKTLLARAVAGEAGVPFFSMSGSEFVEMFVGVGASRVRDLFAQAKERGPCIIFIDELDAVGKSRSSGQGMASNEEREQTLNQLLVEMDGFECGSGILIMAATNRPETLDKALLRAGRFDREVLVDRPDVRGREAILRVHARKVKLGADVELVTLAKRTPGMVGADLANVVNEAALASVRRDSEIVEMKDFEEAVDRIQMGLKKQGRSMSEADKRRVAYHEAGHALVAKLVDHADPVHKVTIIPRSIGALGVTLQLPTEDRYLMITEELLDQICVLFGGRVAEELACGSISTGAENDLERASELARQMVCRFGMTQALGAMTYGKAGGSRFLGMEFGDGKNFSEETARAIDAEVRTILDRELGRARRILGAARAKLDAITRALLVKETLERDELDAIVHPEHVSGEYPASRRSLEAVACSGAAE